MIGLNIENKKKNSVSQSENQEIDPTSNDVLYFPNSENYFPPGQSTKRPTPYPNKVRPFPTKVQSYPNKVQFQSQIHKQNKPFVNKFKPFNQNWNRNKVQSLNHFPTPTRFPSHTLKSPPRRSQEKPKPFGSTKKNNKNTPKVNFQFVEDFINIPQKKPVKRYPQPSSSNTKNSFNQNTVSIINHETTIKGIIDLLKSNDLTIMAALLEETGLEKSIDSEGKSTQNKPYPFLGCFPPITPLRRNFSVYLLTLCIIRFIFKCLSACLVCNLPPKLLQLCLITSQGGTKALHILHNKMITCSKGMVLYRFF